jgi:hypothetical protein
MVISRDLREEADSRQRCETSFYMKMSLLVLAVVASLGASVLSSGCAHQTTSQQSNANERYLTGSYVPQDVQRNGPVTNGKSNVRVLDRSDIDRSGGANLGQALRELGADH